MAWIPHGATIVPQSVHLAMIRENQVHSPRPTDTIERPKYRFS
jgi:hypothetical protein